jgi:hypothetical protein
MSQLRRKIKIGKRKIKILAVWIGVNVIGLPDIHWLVTGKKTEYNYTLPYPSSKYHK